jgi:putative spermidine/putrescine transport system ATP-binding protein
VTAHTATPAATSNATASRSAHGHNLALRGIAHRYGEMTALADINLDIAPGELVALLGPIGCGKTTLLRVIAGFLTPHTGDVLVDGKRINEVPPHRRAVGIVFQSYALFPHMTVADNVAYGLRARGADRARCEARVAEMLRLVQMERFRDRRTTELSGGQQQRVALARALAIEPTLLLLDEPFSALDKNLRLDMQIEIKHLLKTYGITSIIVTHDQEEALSMADRIVVLNQGRVEQVDPPSRIYDRPASLFVNQFVGHTNLLPGRLTEGSVVELAAGTKVRVRDTDGVASGSAIVVSVRPENLMVAEGPGEGSFPAKVRLTLPLGAMDVIEAVTADGLGLKLTRARGRGTAPFASGQAIHLKIVDSDAVSLFKQP